MLQRYRKTITIGILALGLMVAAPMDAEARWFEPERAERVANSGPSEEIVGWWLRIRAAFGVWARSVFIIPEGGSANEGGSGGSGGG